MSNIEKSSLEIAVVRDDKENNEKMSLQMLDVEIINMNSIENVTEEVITKDNISMPAGKRKYLGEEETEVSKSLKRVCMASSSEKNTYDHTYCMKSLRRLRNQLHDLTDKIKSLQKKVHSSKKKIKRRDKKVSTLAAVVSELKEKNLINSDCATMLETTCSGVPKELMKRLVSQKKKKNLGAYPLELRSFAMTLKFYSTKA